MKLVRLSYQDLSSGLSIDFFDFFPDLNLLVGISGAGKTSILNAINNLQIIANGRPLKGIKWDVEFLTSDNIPYRWCGEFASDKTIVSEYICRENREIIKRENDQTWFNAQKIPKLSLHSSIAEIFNPEPDIYPIQAEFNKIDTSFNDCIAQFQSALRVHTLLPDIYIDNYQEFTLEKLQKEKRLALISKLFFLYKNQSNIFQKIKNNFINIFPQVENIEIELYRQDGFNHNSRKVQIKIKEQDSQNWIIDEDISSGMLKSLMYLATIELSAAGSVILIDEFENSLGVNCLDSLTEDLLLGYRDLQFIITSHHPYIINNISPAYWKIVTRKGGVIKVHNAVDFHISKTRQKAFIDLINVLEEFPQGIS